MEKKYMTPKEVSEMYSISEQTVKNWLRSGKVRGFKIGKKWRMEPDAIKNIHQYLE